MDTEWRPVVGFPGYEVSNQGGLRSFWRRGGHPALVAVSRVLTGSINPDGYRYVCLRNAGGERHVMAHLAVLAAFVGPCPEGMEGCHENGDAGDPRLSNLRYDTRVNNDADKDRHGTRPRGRRHGMSKLDERAVAEIRAARAAGDTLVAIGGRFGITHSHVAQICLNRVWTHL